MDDTTVTNRCEHCSDPVKSSRPARFCSDRCRNAANRIRRRDERRAAREFPECQWCGKDIRQMKITAKFCSDPCANRADWRDNADRIRAGNVDWKRRNPEAVKAAGRRYWRKNASRCYEKTRAWAIANPERSAELRRAHRDRHLERVRALGRLREARRNALKESNGGGARRVTLRDWQRLLVRYRSSCAYCGGGQRDQIQAEHVIPLARGGRHAIGNIVPACGNCNQRKSDRLYVEFRYGVSHRRRQAA